MDKDTLQKLFTDQWRACNPHSGKTCVKCSMESCNIQHVIGGVWRRGDQTHACIRSLCKNHPPWANRGTLKRQIRNLYVCCKTGTSHWCDEQCQSTIVDHSDGGHVCQISGIRVMSNANRLL